MHEGIDREMGAKHAKWCVVSARTTGWLRETELVPKTQGIITAIKQTRFALDLALSVVKEPGYDEAWGAEIERRLKEVDDGKAGLMDWEHAKRYIFGDESEPDSNAG